MKKYKKIIILVFAVFIAIVLIAVAVFLYLRNSGKSSFESSSEPELSSAEEWEAGWIRYNGEIYSYNENIVTILIMGIDEFDEVKEAEDGISGGQADAIFLLVLDTNEKDASLIAVDRAAMTQVSVYSEEGEYLYDDTLQICLQHGYGDGMELSCELTVNAISELFLGLSINNYISVNMGAIPDINDAVGGVTITAFEDVTVSRKSLLSLGLEEMIFTEGEEYTLSGLQAYFYVKYRDENIPGSASGRLLRQKQYLSAFADSLKEAVLSNPLVLVELYNAISDYTVTDLNVSEITYLLTECAGYSFDNIYSMEGDTIQGENSDSGFDEFYVDENALQDLIVSVFYEKQS